MTSWLAVARAPQPLGGEERHLRVVGDRAHAPVGRVHVADALGAVAGVDLREGEEFDGRAEGVADGTAEEAAAEAGAGALVQPRAQALMALAIAAFAAIHASRSRCIRS